MQRNIVKVKVDVVSDFICPWCFVGERRLKQFMLLMKDKLEFVELSFHPYRLLPKNFPPSKKLDMYQQKFGQARLQQSLLSLTSEGQTCGIKFNYSPESMIGSSLNAHRLVSWTKEKKLDLIEAIFIAHHEKGLLIADINVLADCAESVGLNRVNVIEFLQSDSLKTETENRIDQVKEEFGLIGGVPHFVFTLYGSQGNETKAVVTGAQNMDYFQIVLERAIKKANL